jgi:VanZ family protein
LPIWDCGLPISGWQIVDCRLANAKETIAWLLTSDLWMKSFLKYWLPVLAWLGLIFAGSTDVLSSEQTSRFLVPFLRWFDPQISPATIAAIHLALRKFGHLLEYGILSMLLWRALHPGPNLRVRMSILAMVVCFVCAIVAATDEFHQSFVRSRTASPNDVLIDICGAAVGLAIFSVLTRRKSTQAETK